MEQPRHHELNKSILEKWCICFHQDYDLTKTEVELPIPNINSTQIKYYNKFIDKMIKPYNETNPTHEKYLLEFYILVFGKPEKLPDRLMSREWRELGFQTKNPRTDFRGAGIMGLHCLRYFVSKYPELFKQMIQTGSEYF